MPPLEASEQIPLDDVKNRIGRACERAGRPADSVCLVAVTKNVSVAAINSVLGLGLRDIGESKVQEAALKRDQIKGTATHHFIGRLQTNKARQAVELFDLIQSVDRPKLAVALDRAAAESGKKQRCLLQIKVSNEETKGGFLPSEAQEFIARLDEVPHLSFQGVMAIAPYGVSENELRLAFRKARKFFMDHRDRWGEHPLLSLGMSDDFEVAIEEGSTMVRVGRALFGERQ